MEEWDSKGVYVNYWETDCNFIQIPWTQKKWWQMRLLDVVQEWAGVRKLNYAAAALLLLNIVPAHAFFHSTAIHATPQSLLFSHRTNRPLRYAPIHPRSPSPNPRRSNQHPRSLPNRQHCPRQRNITLDRRSLRPRRPSPRSGDGTGRHCLLRKCQGVARTEYSASGRILHQFIHALSSHR